jgi:tetratricopeptide (TPR) repeat protein
VTEAEDIWRTDPNTLQDVILNRPAVEARLGECPPLERVWILSLLGRHDEAIKEGQQLLTRSQDRFKPLLVLAHAYQRQYRWAEAGALQEQALRLAFTRTREALVRHHIGRRLFDEARYRDAAAEFEWASDLYRTCGRARLAEASRQAALRSRQVHSQRSWPGRG